VLAFVTSDLRYAETAESGLFRQLLHSHRMLSDLVRDLSLPLEGHKTQTISDTVVVGFFGAKISQLNRSSGRDTYRIAFC
jgi:hypothetical protein